MAISLETRGSSRVRNIVFEDPDWQMTYGERLALDGVVSSLRPRLALEIGSAEGGSLACTAEHSEEVHSFDLVSVTDPGAYPNVTYHTGDSHELLPKWLSEIRAAGRTLDYALVDGDHSAEGVQRDVEDILRSGVLRGVMLAHDPNNPEVRRGLNRVRFEDYPDVTYVDLSLIPGHMTRLNNGFQNQMWGGFALILVDPDRTIKIPEVMARNGIRQDKFYDPYKLVRPVNLVLLASERLRRRVGNAVRRLPRRGS